MQIARSSSGWWTVLVGRTSTSALAAAARRQTQQQRAADEAAARALIARGDACRDKGQWSTARVFYRTAGRQSQDAVRELARARLAELNVLTADRSAGVRSTGDRRAAVRGTADRP